MWSVSLLHGPVPWLTALAAFACLAAVLVGTPRRFLLTRVLPVAGISLVVYAVVAAAADVPAIVGDHFPLSFYLWVWLPVLAVAVCVARWRDARVWQRVAAVVAAPLLLAFAAEQVNIHYAYVPSLADLLGRPVPGQVSESVLRSELSEPAPVTARSVAYTAAATSRPTVASTTSLPSGTPPVVTTASGAQVAEVDIPATVSGFAHRPAMVWLPPAFFARPRPALPIVVMLAGTPGQPANWIRAADADRTAVAYAAAHGGRAPILVFPDHNGSFLGDTECVDGPRGQAETYLTVDVPAFVRGWLGVDVPPAQWAIAGLSEGGTCALMLSLRHPDVYPSFVDISGDHGPNLGDAATTLQDLYGGSTASLVAHDPATLLRAHRYPGLTGWFVVGSGDHVKLKAAQDLDPLATAAGIDTQLVVRPGGHNFAFWKSAFADVLPALDARLER